MLTSALMRTLLVAIPAGLWLAQGHASLGQTLELVAGVALVTWAWIALRSTRKAMPETDPAQQPVALTRRGDCRLERTQRGRPPRDLHCPASGATSLARRSTRR
ncbi:MAG: hypothetical protein QOH83_1018 [Solirubrobacteraceae bacterium]|jgi:hypothetical protein|nr:hypothetical protein [Solirubrobacteraceae bacterium]